MTNSELNASMSLEPQEPVEEQFSARVFPSEAQFVIEHLIWHGRKQLHWLEARANGYTRSPFRDRSPLFRSAEFLRCLCLACSALILGVFFCLICRGLDFDLNRQSATSTQTS
jgi:hypothetical protein